ncbi:glycine-N-acyltransferase-like protein 3 [Uranotaenia lowii]|uniref:glycine-N-acyltransferase-like protein 3 n=1 Tax=Uranotaenia lowii TaxID=190385 RepID=UPI0024796486|nr:glycine-N-acyltransferase-like protein 3 [Uranotaenia lowii]
MANDTLVPIHPHEWTELRDLFKSDWPEHMFAYGVLNNYTRWRANDPTLEVAIYSYNGTWRQNGIFILFDEFEIYFYSFESSENYPSLTEALCLIKWQNYSEVSLDFLEKHRPALNGAIERLDLQVKNDRVAFVYHMSKERATGLKVTVPPGMRLATVALPYLDFIYEQWPLKASISLESGKNLLRRLILFNDNVGLYDNRENLVCWCLRDQTGAFSDLQTASNQVRKGYAQIVVTKIAQQLASHGDDSYAFILDDNFKSCKLFEKVGFVCIGNINWVVIRKSLN